MVNQLVNLIRCNEHLKNNLDIFKEAFISFYGEDSREEIEEKFQKAVILAYRSPETTKKNIEKLKEAKFSEEISKLLLSVQTSFTREKLFGEVKNVSALIHTPIYAFKKFYDSYRLDEEKRKEQFREEAIKEIQDLLDYFLKDKLVFTREDFEEISSNWKIPDKYKDIPRSIQNTILYCTTPSAPDESYESKFHKANNDLLKKLGFDIELNEFAKIINDPKIQDLISLLEQLPNIENEINNFIKHFEEYLEEINYIEIKDKLSNEYYLDYIKENIDLIPEDKRSNLEEFYNKPEKYFLLDSFVRSSLGTSIDDDNFYLQAFSTEFDKKLETGSHWCRENIKRVRINYFRSLGIDLGSNYEDYVNNDAVKRVWPNSERIDKLVESKKRLLNDYYIEYYENAPYHKKLLKEVKQYDFLDKNTGFDVSLYRRFQSAAVCPNLIVTERGYELLPLVLIGCDTENIGYIDHNTVHELNHLIELSLTKVDENSYEAICGWDVIEGEFTEESDSKVDVVNYTKTIRKYEYFNEIINETITKDIKQIMINNGLYVFEDSKYIKDKNTSAYDIMYIFVEDFYKEFKDDIIKSRRGGNIHIIWDKVGKDNFDELNQIIREYADKIKTKPESLYSSIKSQEYTDETRIFESLVVRRDKVLEKMRTYAYIDESNKKKR